jgi:predicted  nucleic acid-binding Zn-ribbon protein
MDSPPPPSPSPLLPNSERKKKKKARKAQRDQLKEAENDLERMRAALGEFHHFAHHFCRTKTLLSDELEMLSEQTLNTRSAIMSTKGTGVNRSEYNHLLQRFIHKVERMRRDVQLLKDSGIELHNKIIADELKAQRTFQDLRYKSGFREQIS